MSIPERIGMTSRENTGKKKSWIYQPDTKWVRESDVQNGGEIKRKVTEHKLIEQANLIYMR